MKIIVTGGAGFLGQHLIRALCARGSLTRADGTVDAITQLIAVDPAQPGKLFVDERVEYVLGDIAAPNFLRHVLAADTDSVFHLAAVNSSKAEADFDLGLHVNVDGMRALLESCRSQKRPTKLVFASSAAAMAPRNSYAIHKLMGEWLAFDYGRKGFVDTRSVRVPSVVVHPGTPQTADGFISALIREPLAGRATVCPVAAQTALWLMSASAAAEHLVHAHEVQATQWRAAAAHDSAVSLPGLRTTVADVIDAVRSVGGEAAARCVQISVHIAENAAAAPAPGAIDDSIDASVAQALGFAAAETLRALVQAYANELKSGA